MRSVKLTPLLLALFLSLASCNLSKESIFGQIGDLEEVDYNNSSPLYKSTTTGVASGGTGNLFVTSSRRLMRRNPDGSWNDLTDSLPSPYNAAVDIVELAVGGIFVAVSDTNGSVLGLVELNPVNSAFPQVFGPIYGSQPNRFFKNQNAAGAIDRAVLYANGPNDAKFLYRADDLRPIRLEDNNQKPPNNMTVLVGMLDPATFIARVIGGGSEQGQVWTNGTAPANINPNYRIRTAGITRVRGAALEGAVSALSGATFKIDPATGALDTATDQVVAGLSESVQPNSYGFIDTIAIVATNFGYFEIDGRDKLTFPTDRTTDVSSYTANQISSTNIHGVYTLDGDNIYLTTYGKGLWHRDPITRKWKGV